MGEIRQRVSCELGFTDEKIFDKFLTRLLNAEKFMSKIRLYGAPTHAYDEINQFEHHRKIYTLFSMVNIRNV